MKKFKKIAFAVLILTIILLPTLSFAQVDVGNPPGTYGSSGGNTTGGVANGQTIAERCGDQVKDIGNIICRISFILNSIIPILMVLGVVYFVWGVITYMIGSDEEAKKKGRDRIIFGIIGLVVIVGMWGLVNLVVDSFGLGNPNIPVVNPVNVVTTRSSTSCFTTYQGTGKPTLADVINYVTCVIGASVIPLLFILAVASFIWGVVQYVINSDEEAKRAKGRNYMIWGIIALVVMVSIWGLVQIFGNTFGINTNFYPTVKTQ